MSWIARLRGEISDLEELAVSLNSHDPRIYKDGDCYYLSSTSFNNNEDAEIVHISAREILKLINGSIKLALDSRKPIEIVHVIKIEDDGKQQVFIQLNEGLNMQDSLNFIFQHSDGTIEKLHPADPIPGWLLIAQKDHNVNKALNYMENSMDNWVGLYHIYEIIRDDMGNEKVLIDKGYATKRSLERFRRTANSPGAGGETARHAVETGEITANPMSFSEAKSLIKGILQAWLSDKVNDNARKYDTR